MELFCHINELGTLAWPSVRALILACNRLSIWAPSGRMLKRFRASNALLPTTDEILWYVEQGHLHVLAREWWFDDRERRNGHRWEDARWLDGFDDRLREVWLADKGAGRTGATARVRVVEDEDGDSWAQERLDNGKIDPGRFVSEVLLLDAPAAWKNKLRDAASDTERALTMLRDMRNHARAFEWSGADRFYVTPADVWGIEQLLKLSPTSSDRAKTQAPAVERFVAAIQGLVARIVNSEEPISSATGCWDRMKSLLAEKDELDRFRQFTSVSDQFSSGLSAETIEADMAQRIIREIEDGRARKRLLDYVAPTTALEAVFDLASLGCLAAGCFARNPVAYIGLSAFAARRAIPAFEWLGVLRERHHGPSWPYYLAEGEKSVRRQRRQQLEDALRRPARKR